MNAEELRTLVLDHFANRAASFDLDPDDLVVDFVLNWGGFTNHSYRVRDSKNGYHLKLGASTTARADLHRWMTLAPMLAPYHAPPILDWIDLGPAAGPLFPIVAGNPPLLDDEVLSELVPMLRRLNADRALAEVLLPLQAITAHAAYRTSFHERFLEDLRGIHESPPPFVGNDLLQWMTNEVSTLSQRIASCSAFDERLTKPVHGDLWLNNVLWSNRYDWHVLDWDELRIGDPAADVAALLGPDARDPRPLKMLERIDGLLGKAELERLHYLGRATLLDWIIDPLSDWIDADAAPLHAHAVRIEKERIHKSALACYRRLYR